MALRSSYLFWIISGCVLVLLLAVSSRYVWEATTTTDVEIGRGIQPSVSEVPPSTIDEEEEKSLETETAEDLSTVLNDRYEEREELTCLKDQTLSLDTDENDWDAARAYLAGMFGEEEAVVLERELERALLEEPEGAAITSLCKYAEELYVTERRGSGEEFEGYRAFIVTGNEGLYPIGEFIVPLGRVVGFSTVLFDDTLGMYARSGDASYTSWYYYRVAGETDGIEQVEWCDRYYGGGWSPYEDEPTRVCEYTYAP